MISEITDKKVPIYGMGKMNREVVCRNFKTTLQVYILPTSQLEFAPVHFGCLFQPAHLS
jgi:hypothetical protein